ncbi:hypothetical protein ACE1CD_36805 [Aerosakkonema sp. BLCC-F183]|uniref:hypothetical protein n=1 Tax=Aerosakkonema sp. BLCC-F183 TaxID=3342834 RepID=UPI0035B9841A
MKYYYQLARKALWAFLIYLPFIGTFTYAIAGGNPLFFITKDILYIPALIALIIYCQRSHLPIVIAKPLKQPLLFLLACCSVTLVYVNGYQQFNSDLDEQPFLMGILGLKVLIGYIPLIFCAYYLIRNKQELRFLIRLHVVLALICCTLALIQYLLLSSGVCTGTSGLEGDALFKAALDARCFVGGALLYNPELGVIRLPGTFAAPWQWGWFLISNGFFTVASAVSETSRRWRNASFVAMALVLFVAVVSGQKIALVLIITIFALLLFFAAPGGNFKRGIIIYLGGAIVLVLGLNTDFFSYWKDSLLYEFIVPQFDWALGNLETFFGSGLGRATNAARIFGETALVETYYPKVLYEIGPLGLLAMLTVISILTFLTFKAYRSVKDIKLRRLGICLWAFVLFISYNIYYYPLDVLPVAIYYWFFAGVLLKLPQLESNQQ